MTRRHTESRSSGGKRLATCMGMALVIASATSGPGFAGAEPLPVYEPGQTFIFSNKRVERFVEREGDGLIWASRSGRQYRRSANFVVPNLTWESKDVVLHRFPAGNPDGLWPLSPRSGARFSVTTDIRRKEKNRRKRRVRQWTCRAQSGERIRVPAGEFETIPIVCDLYSVKSMRVLQRLTWFYAPAVGHYVKKTKRSFRTGKRKSYELVAVLPPEQANKRRIRAILKTIK